MCSCSNDIETTIHFFLHFANFTAEIKTLLDKIITIDTNVLEENSEKQKSNENSLNKTMRNASI